MHKLSIAFFAWALLLGLNAMAQGKAKPVPAKQAPAKAAQSPTPEEEPAKIEKIVAPPGKEVVAVYYFTAARPYGYDHALGAGNAVEAGFVRSTRFVVVERNRFGSLKEEDKFKEAETPEIVAKAARFGAKVLVTGHVVGVSAGYEVDNLQKPTGQKFCEISLSFKIVDVESGQIKLSEIIRGKGKEATEAGAVQNAYIAIGNLVRRYIATYLPQRFKFMSVVAKTVKKKTDYLDLFKIWGGSDAGLKVGDAVEIYQVSTLVNPDTHASVEEKKLLAFATVTEVHSGTTATCRVENVKQASKFNAALLDAVTQHPETIVIEYTGTAITRPKSFWDSF